MLKIIATLTLLARITDWLSRALYRAHIRIDDLRQRVVGAALNATAETLAVVGFEKAKLYTEKHAKRVAEAEAQFDADLKLAYARHTDALQAVSKRTQAEQNKLDAKGTKLRERREALRAKL